MSNTESPPLEVPESVKEWVHVNPLPTLLFTEDFATLVSNEAFTGLLGRLQLGTEAFLRGPLRDNLSAAQPVGDFFGTLRPGDCVVKQIEVLEQHYTFHLIKLGLPTGSCLCCMLHPSQNPAHVRLGTILNAIACFVAEIDGSGNIFFLNDQFVQHLGYARREHGTLTHLRQLLRHFRQDRLSLHLQEVDAQGQTHFRAEFLHKDGSVIAMEVSLVTTQTPGDSLYLLTARDITLQVAHEQSLHASVAQAEREMKSIQQENIRLQGAVDRGAATSQLVYQSEAVADIVQQIKKIAPTDATVLISGETGTGKGLIAQTIHRLSDRADRPFVVVDCASLPPELMVTELFGYHPAPYAGATKEHKGSIAAAHRGTLFLDEVGELSIVLQQRLLRTLQEGQYTPAGETSVQRVDVRVIASSRRDLAARVEEGKFRADLLYRLNVFAIDSTPLRDRKEDIPVLVSHFIRKFNRQYSREITGVDATTLERIAQHDYPGNVGELENMVERAFTVTSAKLSASTTPPPLEEAAVLKTPLLDLFDGTLTEFLSFEEHQRRYIQLVLDSVDGRVSGKGGAAEILSLHPQTLFSKMRKLGIRR